MHANVGLVKTFTANGAINENRIVSFSGGNRIAAQAAASTESFAGVAAVPTGATIANGEPFDVIKSGVADVLYGGTIAVGNRLTTNSLGKAVSAEAMFSGKTEIVDGGSAGNITVTGITTSDVLTAVLYYPISADTGTSATGNKVTSVSDLTSEFSISATNTINNTGGTATTGDKLEVRYRRKISIIGTAEVAGVSGDIGSVLINIHAL